MIFTKTFSTLCCVAQRGSDWVPPVHSGQWIVPATEETALPYWGLKDGIRVGIYPHLGPRGLISIYAPYLGHNEFRRVNFIALEPVVESRRGFSEMEKSQINNVQGLRFRTFNELDRGFNPEENFPPASGKISQVNEHEELTFFLYSEQFHNRARPIIQVMLNSARPHEVGFRTYSATGSAEMDSLILSSTMGNYARLRKIYLKDKVCIARDIWSDLPPDWKEFSPHKQWSFEQLLTDGGDTIVPARPDEEDPASAEYVEEVPHWWKYKGQVATQYWRKRNASEKLVARVNGRKTYWSHPRGIIPNGVSFENFELEHPFSEGDEFWFGVTLKTPQELIEERR